MSTNGAGSPEPPCRDALKQEEVLAEPRSEVREGNEQERRHFQAIFEEPATDNSGVGGTQERKGQRSKGEKLPSSLLTSSAEVSATCILGSSAPQIATVSRTLEPDRPSSVCCDQSVSTSSLSTTFVDPPASSVFRTPLRVTEVPGGSPEPCSAHRVLSGHVPLSFVSKTESSALSVSELGDVKLLEPDFEVAGESACGDTDSIQQGTPRSSLASRVDGTEHSPEAAKSGCAHCGPSEFRRGSSTRKSGDIQDEVDQDVQSFLGEQRHLKGEVSETMDRSPFLEKMDDPKDRSSFSSAEASLTEGGEGGGLPVADEPPHPDDTRGPDAPNGSFSEVWQDWLIMSRKLFESGRAAVYVQQRMSEGDIYLGPEALRKLTEGSCSSGASCQQQQKQSGEHFGLSHCEPSRGPRDDNGQRCGPRTEAEHGEELPANGGRGTGDFGRLSTCDTEEHTTQAVKISAKQSDAAGLKAGTERVGGEIEQHKDTEGHSVQKVVISYRKFKRVSQQRSSTGIFYFAGS